MKTEKDENILILGMSDKRTRYSHMAYERLLEHGYTNLVGVTKKQLDLPRIDIYDHISDVDRPIHTVTLYVGPKNLIPLIDEILELNPKRIISNPGTESPVLFKRAQEKGIEVIEGCTLVMLASEQF